MSAWYYLIWALFTASFSSGTGLRAGSCTHSSSTHAGKAWGRFWKKSKANFLLLVEKVQFFFRPTNIWCRASQRPVHPNFSIFYCPGFHFIHWCFDDWKDLMVFTIGVLPGKKLPSLTFLQTFWPFRRFFIFLLSPNVSVIVVSANNNEKFLHLLSD